MQKKQNLIRLSSMLGMFFAFVFLRKLSHSSNGKKALLIEVKNHPGMPETKRILLETSEIPLTLESADNPTNNRDNLQKIAGIGPKTEKVLNDADINSYRQLALISHSKLEAILADAGVRPNHCEKWICEAQRFLKVSNS